MQRVPDFTPHPAVAPLVSGSPALILALLSCSSASADVVIKEKSVSEGLGGFGDGTSSRTLIVAGNRSRSGDETSAEKREGIGQAADIGSSAATGDQGRVTGRSADSWRAEPRARHAKQAEDRFEKRTGR